jgi:hypothetical protein
MKILRHIIAAQLIASPLLILAQSPASGSVKPTKTTDSQTQPQQSPNDGGRVFVQNCSRCHNAPDGFSPRISGSVVRHMRVRANLSERDAKAVLRFFNP